MSVRNIVADSITDCSRYKVGQTNDFKGVKIRHRGTGEYRIPNIPTAEGYSFDFSNVFIFGLCQHVDNTWNKSNVIIFGCEVRKNTVFRTSEKQKKSHGSFTPTVLSAFWRFRSRGN